MHPKLPSSITTVTPLSKLIALVLFVLLPFMGFYLGINYEKAQKSPVEYITREKVVQVKREENNRDLIKRCGTETLSQLEIFKGHFTQIHGPFWAPDCRHIAWSSWESGTIGMSNETVQKHEGLFVYTEKTGKTERVVVPELHHQIVMQKWEDSKTINYVNGEDSLKFTLKSN